MFLKDLLWRQLNSFPILYVTSFFWGTVYQKKFGDLKTYCMFVGYPRSGHSLVGSILDAHPNMVISHELNALKYLEKGFTRRQLYYLILTNSRRFNMVGRAHEGYVYHVPNQWNSKFSKLLVLGDKMGGSEEVLIEENKNHNLLDSRIVYARSCWSAKSLGKSCKDGCFIGYNVPFIFLVEQEHSATPLKDKTAKTIIEPSNLVVISLIKGNDAQDSVKKSKALSKKTMLKLLDMNNEQETSAIITCLWSNMEGLEIIGDESMKIEQ